MKDLGAKSGFTLMELMVYVALLGGIVLIAGEAFSQSTKMRIRTQSMLQTSQTVGNVAAIIKQDIAQLGAKSAKSDSTIDLVDIQFIDTTHVCEVYMNPGRDPNCSTDPPSSSCCRADVDNANRDSSSFYIGKKSEDEGHVGDTLVMRRLRYKTVGDDVGAYEAVEEVKWLVDAGRVLKRACKSLVGESVDECKSDSTSIVSIAEGVDKFELVAAKPSVEVAAVSVLPTANEADVQFKLVSRFGEDRFERLNIEHSESYTKDALTGFVANYDYESNVPLSNTNLIKANQVFMVTENLETDDGTWNYQCKSVTLSPFIEYEISFTMPRNANDPTGMFCPGRDMMAVGFRYKDGAKMGKRPEGLSDFQFYPPTTNDLTDVGLRKMRFKTNVTIEDVCLGFTFAFFSPVASSGKVFISDLKLKKIPSSNYTFTDDAIAIADKKNVKAIKMKLSLKKNGEAGEETAIISVPSNGPRD